VRECAHDDNSAQPPAVTNVAQYASLLRPTALRHRSTQHITCNRRKLDIFSNIPQKVGSSAMTNSAQKRALWNYRTRLVKRGLTRFEVLGLDTDRDLIRSLAKRLSEGGADAVRIRAAVSRAIAGEQPKKGGILAVLRRSPLVGADLNLARSRETGRKQV
jgi:hypothetical protein